MSCRGLDGGAVDGSGDVEGSYSLRGAVEGSGEAVEDSGGAVERSWRSCRRLCRRYILI